MPPKPSDKNTQKSLKLILPAPAEGEASSNSSGRSSPSPSATLSSPVSLASSSPSSPKSHRCLSNASIHSTPSSTLSMIWHPLAALPTPPTLSDVVVSAFFSLEDTAGDTTASDSGVWADVEDLDDGARVRRASRSRSKKGKRLSSAPTVLALPAPDPLLVGAAKRPPNTNSVNFTFSQRRDPHFGVTSPTPSSGSGSGARRPPRIRGAPLLYRQDRIRPCTCGAEFEDSSTTTTTESEADGSNEEEEAGGLSVGGTRE